MAIDLQRAARIGLLSEAILQLIAGRAVNGQASLSANEILQLRAATGATSNNDIVFSALGLIGEADIQDAYETEEGGVIFVLARVARDIEMPRTILQALRQHGISETFANTLFSQCHSINELDEQTFLRFCLRESAQNVVQQLTRHWQPSPFCRAGLKKRGVGETFVDDLIPEFILIFNEKPRAVLSFDLEFFRFAAVRWQRYVNAFDESTDLRPLPPRWQPSVQLVKHLEGSGFTAGDIEKLLPHFRLAAHERGNCERNWGSVFLKYCLGTLKARRVSTA